MEDSGIVIPNNNTQEDKGLDEDLAKMHLLEGGGSGTNSLSSDDSGIGLISPPRTPPYQQQAFLTSSGSTSSSPSRAASSSVTYSPYVNGSIFSVPKSWSVTDNGENLVVSVYAFVKSFLG